MKAKISRISTPLIVWGAAFVYIWAYLSHPALPGNDVQHPLGWWGWFDQEQYLRAAKAYLSGDLAPGNFFYPPLYPLLGALFFKWLPNHPFFFVDGLAFVWFSYVFIRIGERYLSSIEAVILLIATVFLNQEILENFVIPWSTAGTVAIYSFAFYMLLRLSESSREQDGLYRALFRALVFSSVLGLLVLLRPVDAAGSAFMFLGYLYLDWRARGQRSFLQDWRSVIAIGAMLVTGVLFCTALYAVYNIKVFGNPVGGYMGVAADNGYFLSRLPSRAFSLIFDSWSVYLEPGASFVGRVPWVLAGFLGVMLALFTGDALLIVIALSIVLAFVLYVPYGDLQPTGLWRYKNIHYFVWMFPYLGLLAWISTRWLVGSFSLMRRVIWPLRYAVVAGFFLLMTSLHFSVDRNSVRADVREASAGQSVLAIALHSNDEWRGVDFIDLQGISGGLNELYFGGSSVEVDGRKLRWVRDYRLIPAPWGARMYFNAPVKGSELVFSPGAGIFLPKEERAVSVGYYKLSIGYPCFRRDVGACISLDSRLSPLDPGDLVEHNSSNVIFNGWSGDEAAFRWSEGKRVSISFLSDGTSGEFSGHLKIQADPLGKQSVKILLNGVEFYSGIWQSPMPTVDVSFSPSLLKNGINVLTFDLPDAHPPGNGDPRVLALALKGLVIL